LLTPDDVGAEFQLRRNPIVDATFDLVPWYAGRIGCLPSAHLVLNFRDPAPPSPRGVLAYATPKRLPFRLITRNLSSGMWPSFFSSFSKSALKAASASTIAPKDFFTSAGKSSASIFCHFNSSLPCFAPTMLAGRASR